MAWEVLLLVVWVGCAFGAHEIGKSKGLPRLSLVLGLLISAVGVITAASAPQTLEAKVETARPSDLTNPTAALIGNI